MPSDIAEITLPAALEQARAEAAETGLPYAGGVTPPQPGSWCAPARPCWWTCVQGKSAHLSAVCPMVCMCPGPPAPR